jgi:hypothetical protein
LAVRSLILENQSCLADRIFKNAHATHGLIPPIFYGLFAAFANSR